MIAMREISIRSSKYVEGQLDLAVKHSEQHSTVVTLTPEEVLLGLRDAIDAYDAYGDERADEDATPAPTTVAQLLAALDASGDGDASDAANLIRSIGARHPDILDIENAEL